METSPGRFPSLRLPWLPWLGGLVLAGLLPSGCGPDAGTASTADDDRRPDVLLVVIDTLRADRTGVLQPAGADNTPALTALGARGATYRQAVAPAAWTLPSMAALMAGHDVVENRRSAIPDEPALAERFAAAGWRTAALTANPLLTADNGFARGFDSFEVAPASSTASLQASVHELRAWDAQALTERALVLLGAAPAERPVFLYLHLMDAHVPYDPQHAELAPPASGWSDAGAPLFAWTDSLQDAQRQRLAGWRRAYDGQVRFADAALGRLIARLADVRRRPFLVAVTADHGEGLFSHAREADSPALDALLGSGYPDHGEQLHEESLRVPLWLCGPGVPPGLDERRPVPTARLGPTLLALAGLPATGDTLPLHAGDPVPELIFSVGTRGWSARSATRKFIEPFPERLAHEGIAPRLFAMQPDDDVPWAREFQDLSASEPDTLRRLSDDCEAWRRRNATTSPETFDSATEERLRALGYVR